MNSDRDAKGDRSAVCAGADRALASLSSGDPDTLSPAALRELVATLRAQQRALEAEIEGLRSEAAASHKREAQYQLISRLTSDYVFQLDVAADGGIEMSMVSDRYEPDTGRRLDQARTPAQWAQLIHPDDAARFFDLLKKLIAEGGTIEFEGRFRREDGRFRSVHVVADALRDSTTGRVATIVGAVADITARRQAEQLLELLKYSVDVAPHGAYWIDPDGQFVYVNQAGCQALGCTQDEMLKMSVFDVNPRATPARWAEVWNAMKARGSSTLESEHRRKDGSVFPVQLTQAYVKFGDREYCNGFAEDLTERKRADAERRKLESQLAQSQKMESVGRLAGGVAHDFNNMLGVILGHAEMALGQLDHAHPLHADLLEIQKAAQRSADLTSQLLAFARRQTVAPRVLDLNETVDGMLKMLRRLIGEDISLAWIPGKDARKVRVDPSQVNQLLANLCVNARDAIAGVGAISIETGIAVIDEAHCADHRDASPGTYVVLGVGDNGCGMTSEIIDHLFEPFFTTKGPREGTGLGLATVYGIVRQNGGFVDVCSEPGKGTTFRIYLPEYQVKAGTIPAVDAVAQTQTGKETVLLVEDEPAILKVATRMLERLGYDVLPAGTPGSAIRIADEHPGDIHLLVADVVMPEMNGRDLAKRLIATYPAMKRLFMSGYTADVIAHRGVLDEGVHFIQKPFTSAALSVKVREALDHR